MLWLSEVAGSSTDILTLQRQNKESVQSDVERIRQEIASGKRHKVGSPEWMKEAGLVYNVKEERVDRLDEINQAVNQAVNESVGVDEPLEKRVLPKPKDFYDITQEEYEPLSWVIPGMISEGCGLLVSAPKMGKSFFVLDLAVSVANGAFFLGSADEQGLASYRRKVLYMALEDGDRRLNQRWEMLGKEVKPGQIETHTDMPEGMAYYVVEDFIQRNPDGLVIIDTLVQVMGDRKGSVTQYQHDYRSIAQYQHLAKNSPGSCILIVHHDRKETGGDRLNATSGTKGLTGAADFHMALSGRRESKIARLQVTGREIEDYEYTIRKEDNGFWVHDEFAIDDAPETQPERRGKGPTKKDELLFLITSNPGSTPKELFAMSGWSNYNSVTNLLPKMVREELIRKTSGGKYVAVE